MPNYLSPAALKLTAPAETAFKGPIPTQIVSNGEFTPSPQTRDQQRVEVRTEDLASELAPRHGVGRRQFLASAAGMAAAFVAMNEVFGRIFDVTGAEAATPGVADARADALSRQFIFDVQTHFVRDDFQEPGLTALSQYAFDHWNRAIEGKDDLSRFKFENYLKEVFVDSDTKMALLSGAPSDDPKWNALSNDQIARTRSIVNKFAGSRRMLAHSLINPKVPGWQEAVARAISDLKPDSWKGYTIGDPLSPSTKGTYWRLDDEKLVYKGFYERIVKTDITTVCIHKGLLPFDYEQKWSKIWDYATVQDLGKAAKDWPQITFVIYHAALRPFMEDPYAALVEFEQTGRIKWATDLAEIPAKHGVRNVYAEVGTAFANSAVSSPRFAAALMGTLIRGLGADHVIWGTDSVWYGSPQWQIEAMRRLEIPEDMQKQHGFAPLGPADGPVKTAIFGGNAARLYRLNVDPALGRIPTDHIDAIKAAYRATGGLRSNTRYGYVCPPGGRLG